MHNSFYSKINKNAIKGVINDNIEKKFHAKINNNYDNMIDETMQYVASQVSDIPPKGMKNEEYLFLMNKKVYDIVTPVIEKKVSTNIKYATDENIKNESKKQKAVNKEVSFSKSDNDKLNTSLQNNLFDPLLLKQFETPSLMDYPKPSASKNGDQNIDKKIKNLTNDRETLTPKIRPVDFTIKSDNENKVDTTQLYNELLLNYNSQVSDMSNFENTQKNRNQKIELDEINGQNDPNIMSDSNYLSTPIDLLENKNYWRETESHSTGLDKGMGSGLDTRFDGKRMNTSPESNKVMSDSRPPHMIESFMNYSTPIGKASNEIIPSNYGGLDHPSIVNMLPSQKISTNYSSLNPMQNFSPAFGPAMQKSNGIMLDEPIFKLIEKKFHIIFDSADRDLYENPNQTSFQVKFAPAGNNLKFEAYYDQYNTLILNEKLVVYGDGSKLSVNETFDNIYNISCSSVNVPVNIVYLGNIIPFDNLVNVPMNIYKDSYVYLSIPELRGPYRGGNLLAYNSFAKLLIDYTGNTMSSKSNNVLQSNFATLKTSETNESFLYDPVSAGKIDKMTLNLLNKNGNLYNFGIDKLFVAGLKEGAYRYNGYCGDKYLTTIITIQSTNDEYIKYCSLYNKIGQCNLLNSHNVSNGDLLYFYDTLPNNDQVVLFEDYIKISKMKYNKKNGTINIYLHYIKNIDNVDQDIAVNLKDIIPGANINNENIFKNYYIVIINVKTNKYYYLRIQSFTNDYIVVDYLEVLPQFKDYNNLKIGVAKNNLRGSTDEDKLSLFSNHGYNVLQIGTTLEYQWEVEIDFPYIKLPEYLKNPLIYRPGDVFFIQEKMQISYTFTVTIMTKDYQKLKSGLNESGNN